MHISTSMFIYLFILGLRHVSDDQKTHKNPNLRAQGPPVRSPTKSHTPSPTSPKTTPQQSHSPLLELEGKKWRVVSSIHISHTHTVLCLQYPQRGCTCLRHSLSSAPLGAQWLCTVPSSQVST